jgi:hypothetical protein
MASSPVTRWGTGWQTSDGGLGLGSPVIDWWRWIGPGGRRQAVAAAQRRRGCGSSDVGEGRGGAEQCAASGASMWPREEARQVTGRGGSAEGRARRWRSGGGRGSSDSGDRAARLDQQLGELLGCTRKSLGACVGEGVDGGRPAPGGANGGRRGSVAGARARKERPRAGFYRRWRSVRG